MHTPTLQQELDNEQEAHACDVDALVARVAELEAALEIATPTVELYTGNGARSNPQTWPKNDNGDIDHEQVAKICRAALAKARQC